MRCDARTWSSCVVLPEQLVVICKETCTANLELFCANCPTAVHCTGTFASCEILRCYQVNCHTNVRFIVNVAGCETWTRHCVYCFIIVDCTMKFAGCEILRWYCVNCFTIVHWTVTSAACKIWIRFCVNCFTNAHCTLRFAGCEAWRCCANCVATANCDSINHVVAKHLGFHEPDEYFALWSQQAYESHANGCDAPVTAGTVSVQWTAVDNHATSFVGKCCTFSMHCSGCCPCCLDMFECA